MKKVFVISIIALAVVCLCSCASMKGKTQEVTIKSNPVGALVKVDGVTRGKAPLVVDLDKTSSHVIEFSMEGYETQYIELKTRADKGAILGDILLFGPLVTVFDVGDARTFKENEIWAEMVPINP